MAEVLALVASIIEVSAFGLQLSKCLRDYGSAVVGAERRLSGLDKDISFTSGILSELGTLLNDARVQALVSEQSIRLAREAVAECDGIFQAMEGVIANIRKNGLGKFKMYFRETKIELLRSNLDRMKGNLTLLMGVIHHATQISLERPDETTLAVHRRKIRELMVEKEAYTQRYLVEKQKYDALLAKINSTSTLGSISTTRSGPVVPESSTTCIQAETLASPTRVEDLTLETAPCLLPPSHCAVNFDDREPPHDRPPDSSHAASLREVRVRPISTFGANTTLPQRHLSKSNESTTANTQPKPSNRNKALKIARRVARGTGYVAAGVAAVAFFPITIVMFVVLYRRRKTSKQQLPASFHLGPVGDLEAMPGYIQPPMLQGHEMYMPVQQAYSSALMPAELPAVHELSDFGHGGVEMELVGTLTQVSPEQGRAEDRYPAPSEWF
ncbi:hypothetical protein EDB81DRAFT_376260 [Dactylonectria macrodidyma]|uniref:Fungal N-terminal domain-containing protein n=1 Tax=Dactylonectria macrodidyma TaxID=307937 RepID=A0A9P9J840_9HYPO|nr:hypothetical protein EDB81DRAFT_376260 [Dactylonectria macrodidyma]